MKHIILLGYSPSYQEHLNLKNANYTLILHEHLAECLNANTLNLFAHVGVLKVPHNMNLNEYIEAMDQIEAEVDTAVTQFGPPTAIVGLYEHVTLPAAILREKYGLSGTSKRSAQMCRDKVVMKNSLAEHGIRVPSHMTVSSVLHNPETLQQLSYGRVVLKPISQAACEGVQIYDSRSAAYIAMQDLENPQDYEVEDFIQGKMHHCDGAIKDGKLRFLSVSHTLDGHRCYDAVKNKQSLISISIDDETVFSKVEAFINRVLAALSITDSAFHCEFFICDDGEPVFLEIGNRFGGAGIPLTLKSVFGYDIVKESLYLECGMELDELPYRRSIDFPNCGTHIHTPLPTEDYAIVKTVHGLDDLPDSIVTSTVLNPGDIINQSLGPFPCSATFILKSPSFAEAVDDSLLISKSFFVDCI